MTDEGGHSVVDEGQGPTVLLVHGTPTWSFEWRHLIRNLSRDFRCIAPDHLGFGLSERPSGAGYLPEDHARRLSKVVRSLDLDDITLVVHDFGGPIALPLCFEPGVNVRRLVVLNSFAWPLDQELQIARGSRFFSSRLGSFLYRRANFSLRVLLPKAYGTQPRLPRQVHDQYLAPFRDPQARTEVLWPLACALLGSGGHYARIWEQRQRIQDIPALVIWGARDVAFPAHFLDRWKDMLPAAEIQSLPLAGHWPHDQRPEEVLPILRDFLARTEMRSLGTSPEMRPS